MSMDHATLELQVRVLVAAGRVKPAVELVLTERGGPLFGYIARLVGDEDAAGDAFQVFSIGLWEGLAAFRWESSLRTWLYTVARNAAYRRAQDPFHRRGERLGTAEQSELADRQRRDVTARWLQTREKSRLWALIEELEAPDRELMVLRLGRRMSWLDVAAVMNDGMAADPGALKSLAAKARKRFERVKAQLAAGLADA